MSSRIAKSPLLLDLEDRANSLTHAVGVGVFLAGLALLAVLSVLTHDLWKVASVSVFGVSLVLLYSTSALYHAAREPTVRKLLRVLDHLSIRLLIAGTYTPFLLVNLRGPWGWSLFWTIWGLALVGVVADFFFTGRAKLLSTILYIVMGWVIVVAIGPLSRSLPPVALWLLVFGGLAYTLGAVFYILDKRIPFGHALWHLFVLSGSVCHFLAVVLGVLPYPN